MILFSTIFVSQIKI